MPLLLPWCRWVLDTESQLPPHLITGQPWINRMDAPYPEEVCTCAHLPT